MTSPQPAPYGDFPDDLARRQAPGQPYGPADQHYAQPPQSYGPAEQSYAQPPQPYGYGAGYGPGASHGPSVPVPYGQFGGYPQQFVVNNVVPVVPPKSVGLAALLAFLFGPLGMFYSTISGALIMLLVTLVAGVMTFGVGLFITWPLCVAWAAASAAQQNSRAALQWQAYAYQQQQQPYRR